MPVQCRAAGGTADVRVSPSPGNDPAVICTAAEVELGVVRVGETG